jgi:RNA polymerase subunit RPABC4/transcription elongation factor Spt4
MQLISIVGGLFFALFILMVGYVNADTKRRGMNSLLWTLLVIFIPKAIGFLAYFLLRKPLLVAGSPNCPKCGTGIGPDFRFCPKCGYSFTPSCANCGRPISRDYICCPYCGKTVGAAMPQQSPQPS